MGTDRKFKLKVAVHSIGFRGTAKGKVASFKHKSSGWKRSRSEMAVGVFGRIYNNQCSFNFSFDERKPSPSGYKKRKQLTARNYQFGSGGLVVFRAKPGELASDFTLSSGESFSLALQ